MEPLNGAVFLMPHGNKVLPCFCGEEENTAAAPLFVSVLTLPIQGKDGNMKKLIDFEYDLWTTEEGKCMARVRFTGEECEVDRETFRLLRAEEKRLRRDKRRKAEEAAIGKPLSLDVPPEEIESPCWLVDTSDFTVDIVTAQLTAELRQQLTQKQLEVFEKCMVEGMSIREFARKENRNYRSIWETREAIQKKFIKIFGGYPIKDEKNVRL